jgi:hypothetical protein
MEPFGAPRRLVLKEEPPPSLWKEEKKVCLRRYLDTPLNSKRGPWKILEVSKKI